MALEIREVLPGGPHESGAIAGPPTWVWVLHPCVLCKRLQGWPFSLTLLSVLLLKKKKKVGQEMNWKKLREVEGERQLTKGDRQVPVWQGTSLEE